MLRTDIDPPNRRRIPSPSRRWLLSLLALPVAAGLLAALPAGAAEDQAALVAQSKSEKGLRIYSNVNEISWTPVVRAFNAKYPWIQVEALDLGPSEAFERYYAENSAKLRSADMIAVASPEAWIRFVERNEVEPYEADGAAALPGWSKPFPGVYTLSTDPLVLVYNKVMLGEAQRPRSLAKLAEVAAADPATFKGKLTTYDATSHSFASAAHWTYAHAKGDAGWKVLEALGPLTKPEGGGATMVEKLTTGEYVAAYFNSGVTLFPRLGEPGRSKLLDWSLIEDGTPVFTRGIAVTKGSQAKASAKLFLDFVLSREGQIAVGKGGLTPYRDDVAADVPYMTLGRIRSEIGEQNVLLVGYDKALVSEGPAFLKRWKEAFKL